MKSGKLFDKHTRLFKCEINNGHKVFDTKVLFVKNVTLSKWNFLTSTPAYSNVILTTSTYVQKGMSLSQNEK